MHNYKKFYINGEWVAPRGKGTIEVIDPTTEQPCGSVPSGDAADVDAAIAAAKAAFPGWAATSAAQRSAFIGQLAAKLNERKEELGALIAQELGMPVGWSIAVQVGLPTGVMASYIPLPAEMDKEETIGNSLVIKEPVEGLWFYHALELSPASDCWQGCACAGGRMYDGPQTELRDTA